MSASTVEIDRVPLSFVMAAAPERAERLSRRVCDVVASALPDAVSKACGNDLDADDSYIFIDRLDVQCVVAAHWADDAIVAAFAQRLAQALARERELGQTIVFRDRAEFLAAFFASAVEGQAFTRWWFAEFDGLRPLVPSAVIRTAMMTESAVGWEALGRLSPQERRRVIGALTVRDAEAILASLADIGSPGPVTAQAVVAALESTMALPMASGAHRLLLALASLVYAGDDAASVGTLDAMRGVAALIDCARSGRLPPAPGGDSAAVLIWCDAAGLDDGARRAVVALEAAALVACVRRARANPTAEPDPAASVVSFDYTPLGGVLLLCVVLVRTGWWHRWRDALRAAGMAERSAPLAAWLALAVAARAMDARHAESIERHPILRRVFGVPDTMGVSRGRRLGRLLRAHASRLLRETARRIPGCEGSTAAYLRSQCLSMHAGVRPDGGAARLGRAPLDVLLMLSGLKRATVTLPDGRTLALAEEAVE